MAALGCPSSEARPSRNSPLTSQAAEKPQIWGPPWKGGAAAASAPLVVPAPLNAILSSIRPVLHLQPAHPPELLLVISNQRQPRRQRVCSNPEIVVADHLPFGFKLGSDFTIGLACGSRKGQNSQ